MEGKRTPIRDISRYSDESKLRVVGKIILSSGLQLWEKDSGIFGATSGQKIFFDLADDTGIIRVFGWNEAARNAYATGFIRRNQFIKLRDCDVYSRNDEFNNTHHRYELQLTEDTKITPLPDDVIPVIREKAKFVPLSAVPAFSSNVYFNVRGRIVDVRTPFDGVGRRGKSYEGQKVEIEDRSGSMIVMSWDRYIPLTDDVIGRTLTLIGCKYVPEWKNINSEGAQVLIDGERVDFQRPGDSKDIEELRYLMSCGFFCP